MDLVKIIYNLSITTAVAAPPPLQIAATPSCPGFKRWTRDTRMREPDDLLLYFKIYPIGWPNDTPPPAIFTFEESKDKIL